MQSLHARFLATSGHRLPPQDSKHVNLAYDNVRFKKIIQESLGTT